MARNGRCNVEFEGGLRRGACREEDEVVGGGQKDEGLGEGPET